MKRFFEITDDTRAKFRVWSSRVFILTILLFLFFVAGGGISHKTKWRIENINISGANVVPMEDVRSLVQEKLKGNYFYIYARENSWLFPKSEIEKSLLQTFPRLSSAMLLREDDNAISVKLSERKPYALWCGKEPKEVLKDCWFIDNSGFVFDKAPVFSDGVYVEIYAKLSEKITGEPVGSLIPHNRFVVSDTFAKLISESIGKPSRILLKENSEMEIVIYASSKHAFLSGARLRFLDESKPEALLKKLLLAIPAQFPTNIAAPKKLLYIDMRFGDKVIFGFEN